MDRRRFLAGVTAAATATGGAGRVLARQAAEDWRNTLTAKAQAPIDAGATPGLQVAVWRGGEALFSQGFGQANLETAAPLTPASVMRVGSVTKQFTAAVMLQLQQEGRLSLDDALARYRPDIPRAQDLILRRMLNHTSGLGNYTDRPDRAELMQAARADRTTAQNVAEVVAHQPFMAYEPGQGWAYSNSAYVLLGALIEQIDDRPLGETMKARLFDPLGLADTALDDAARVVPNRASGYTPRRGGGFDNAAYVSMSFPAAAGALRSTCDDLCRWTEALHGGRVLNAGSLDQMLTPGRLIDGSRPLNRRGLPRDYGLGLIVTDHPRLGRVAMHDGDIMGFSAIVCRFLDTGLNVAVVSNCDAHGDFEALLAGLRAAADGRGGR
ncbi:serine hydrolase domain-containing protein [Brevundimonas sp.]|uniref:serine hydrolase domain-containing protein n=1 Tax=Brevundimonas sp. TaxID=1871086 RepID=UPI002FD990F7